MPKMKKQTCPPDECPKKGQVYECAAGCGFKVEVTADCGCEDVEYISLACCGAPMKLLTVTAR